MSDFDRAALKAVLRQDFEAFVRKVFHTLCPGQEFVPEWYISAIAHQLERVRRGEIRRLIINLPPRSLKSIMASVAFPAFILGHDPTRRIICSSYSGELAFRHSNDFRTILTSPWYQEYFTGTRIGPYKDSETEIELIQRGFRLATSTGGTLTGRGGDFIIIDDPLKLLDAQSDAKRNGANEWLLHTVLSRLDDKRTGAIIIVMQRVHIDDLTGFVLRQSDDWTVLSLPAIAESEATIPLTMGQFHWRRPGDLLSPVRLPEYILDRERRDIGSAYFCAQYQQAPEPPGGLMVKRHWVKRYTELPPRSAGCFIIQSYDTAARGGPDNDWSVCTTWLVTNDGNCYLLHVWRDRVDYPTLKAKLQEHAKQWGANQVLVEEAGTALGLLDELKGKVRGLTGIKPDRDKVTRMAIASAMFQGGQVYFPERASWLPQLEEELFSFPGGRHDDQVDAISQMLNFIKSSGLWTLIKLGRAPPLPTLPMSAAAPRWPWTDEMFCRPWWG